MGTNNSFSLNKRPAERVDQVKEDKKILAKRAAIKLRWYYKNRERVLKQSREERRKLIQRLREDMIHQEEEDE